MDVILAIAALLAGVVVIVWGAETFAEHLAAAARQLRITNFALALLLAGAEPYLRCRERTACPSSAHARLRGRLARVVAPAVVLGS